uniref:Uncharacterized protein n=1 Tax=Ditylenchus dipsaci TaxID=166011 RepID=A0A915EH64_9BILA
MDQPNFSCYEAYRKQKSEVVPNKLSRDAWFNFCVNGLASRLKQIAKEESNDSSASEILEIMEDLLLGVDQRSKSESELPLFLDVFSALVLLVESKSVNIRKRAQSVFFSLLDCLHYECQVKALCQLFRLVADRKLEVEMEPQVLAWFMDLYRRKLSLTVEEEQCHQVFRTNLSSFYDLIDSLVYEDMVTANQFYVAAMLIIEEQALHSFDLPLLRKVKNQLLEKFQTQLAEYSRLKGIQLNSGVNPIVQQEMFSLELLKFTVTDVRRKIDKVLTVARKLDD